MQDVLKEKNTDKGWSAMRDILDREMPTEPKHRRFIGWWFAGLLIPFVGFGCWYYWNTALQPTRPDKKSVDAPISPFSAVESQSSSLQNHVNSGPNNGLNKTLETTLHLRVNTTERLAKNSFQQTLAAKHLLSSSTNVVSTQPSFIPPIHNLTEVISSFPNDSFNVLTPLSTRQVPNLYSSQRTQTTLLSEALPQKKIEISKRRRYQMGVSTSLATEKFNSINQLTGGLSVQWSLTGPWGVRTGLFFNHYTPSINNLPVASLGTSDINNTQQAGYVSTDLLGNIITTMNGTPAVGDIIVPVQKSMTIEIPLLVSYHIPKKIRLFGGVSTSFITAIQTGNTVYWNGMLITGDVNKRFNNLAIQKLERWRLDGQCGIGTMLTNNIEIGVSAKFPIRSIESVSPEEAGNFLAASSDRATTEQHRMAIFSVGVTYFWRDRHGQQ